MVDRFKDLRLTLDNKLTSTQHTLKNETLKRSHQRLSAICEFKKLYASPSLPAVVAKYCSTHPALLLYLFQHALYHTVDQTYMHNQHCCQDNRSRLTQSLRAQL